VFIPSARAEAVARRTYQRPLDNEGSKFETWQDTIHRSHYEHHIKLWEGAGGKPNLNELNELVDLGLSRSGTVAGRTLWLGGTEYAYSRSCSQFNCAALEISTVYDIVDAFWLLLNGCGVGAICVSGTLHGYSKVIKELVIIPSTKDKDYRGEKTNHETKPCIDNDYTWTIKVGDSAEAWAKALGKLLISPRGKCNRLIIDFSECRGRGGRLKGYGWICNGSEPLKAMFIAVHALLNQYAGNILDEEAIGDIFNHCGTVLSSRRAAESLVLPSYHPLSAEFIHRKFEYWKSNNQRRQSNNSLLFWTQPSIDDIVDLLKMNYIGGEPGFINGLNALKRCPWFKLFNPCQPGWAYLRGENGLVTMDDLKVGDKIWSETGWTTVTKKWSTGVKPVYRYRTTAGVFYGTRNHRVVSNGIKVEAGEAESIDILHGPNVRIEKDWKLLNHSIMDGLVLGDGTCHKLSKDKVYLTIGEKDNDYFDSELKEIIHRRHPADSTYGWVVTTSMNEEEIIQSRNRRIPERYMTANQETVCGFLRGLYSANGGVVGKGRVVLTTTSKQLVEDVQILLSSIGIRSYFTSEDERDNEFSNGTYRMKKSYKVNITAHAWKFADRIGFIQKYKMEILINDISDKKTSKPKYSTYQIVEEEYIGDMEVFDISVDNQPHTYWTGGCNVSNCFEILLASYGFCNLVSLCLPHFKRDFARLRRAVWIMARANYRQTCVNLSDPILQPMWNQTNEALRLCGVSLTGIVQAPWLSDYQIKILRNEAIFGAYSMADELSLPRPKAVTTLKPEGTRSKIAGSPDMEIAEGMHLPLGRYIMNWINFSIDDPMVKHLEASGFKTMLNPSDANNMLVRFPIEYSGCPFSIANGKEVNTESAITQLERYQRWNSLWADHNVSATVSISPAEIPDTARWIHQNWDRDYVATAFIARTDPTMTAQDIGHPYLPQEVVTEEVYEKAISKIKPVDWESAHTGWYDIDEPGCIGGVCPTK
jgi:hypothetical protein